MPRSRFDGQERGKRAGKEMTSAGVFTRPFYTQLVLDAFEQELNEKSFQNLWSRRRPWLGS
jgi:hypothetical protein